MALCICIETIKNATEISRQQQNHFNVSNKLNHLSQSVRVTRVKIESPFAINIISFVLSGGGGGGEAAELRRDADGESARH